MLSLLGEYKLTFDVFNFLPLVSSICKDGFYFKGGEISVSWSIHRHLSNLQTESAAFLALVLQALGMVFLLWVDGSVWQDLRVAGW